MLVFRMINDRLFDIHDVIVVYIVVYGFTVVVVISEHKVICPDLFVIQCNIRNSHIIIAFFVNVIYRHLVIHTCK